MILFLNDVRLSFPDLFEPTSAAPDAPPKFGGDFLLEDSSVVYCVDDEGNKKKTTLEKAMNTLAKDTWGDRAAQQLKSLEASKKCVRDGDNRMTAAGEVYAGYEGKTFLTAKNTKRPTVLDRDKSPLTKEDGRPYSGCYVNAKVDMYALKDARRKGIHASLLGVQFYRDGEAFGGSPVASADDFEDFGDEPLDDDDPLADIA